jgi:hypothetical protein
MCTKTHGELNGQSCHQEVQEGVNHAPVLSLVDSLAIFIWTQRRSRAHRSRHGLELSHVELLHYVLRVLGFMYEDTLFHLLDLDT